jgi:hypothetical protein
VATLIGLASAWLFKQSDGDLASAAEDRKKKIISRRKLREVEANKLLKKV